MSSQPISLSPKLGAAHIAVWVVLGSTSWAVLVGGVMLAVRLVG